MKPAHSLAPALAALAALASCAVRVDSTEHRGATPPPPRGAVYNAAPGALGPYSGSVRSGDLIFVSGKIGERGGGFEQEVTTALDAVEAELQRAGASLRDVVAATVYLTDLERYAELNALYAARFREPWPARVCVEVSRLPGDAQVEIQVVARRP